MFEVSFMFNNINMMKFDIIGKNDIELAIERLRSGEIPDGYQPSTDYDVDINGVQFPPKQIIAFAYQNATGKFIEPKFLRGGKNTQGFKILEKYGYKIIPKRNNQPRTWIFQGDPKKFQIDKYLNSGDEFYWIVNQNKKLITLGDIVYIWRSGKNAGIIAVAEIISEVNVFPYDLSEYWIKQPKNKSDEQLRVRLKILERRIDSPLTKDNIRDYLPDWSFLKSALGTNFKLTSEQAEIISGLLSAPKFDDYKEKDIQGRTDITPGQKWTLTKARSGQGIFKDNVIKNEKICRVTGVVDINYLHASHIKPWSKSDDIEKLHGCNGLLLSPHIHILFDKGLISFSDEGEVLVSSKLDSSILNAWGIVKGSSTGNFSKMQREFMSYHRQNIFII